MPLSKPFDGGQLFVGVIFCHYNYTLLPIDRIDADTQKSFQSLLPFYRELLQEFLRRPLGDDRCTSHRRHQICLLVSLASYHDHTSTFLIKREKIHLKRQSVGGRKLAASDKQLKLGFGEKFG